MQTSDRIPTQAQLSGFFRRLCAGQSLVWRLMAAGRPYIAPFSELIAAVPRNANVLDCGCGSGLFLAALSAFRDARSLRGFDLSETALAVGRRISEDLVADGLTGMTLLRQPTPGWLGAFDVVTMLDVMHHLPFPLREQFLREACANTAPGGIFLYKDMASRPRWRVLANVLHDLVLARQLVRVSPISDVERIAEKEGFVCEARGSAKLWWYAHEWRVFRRPAVN